MFISARPSLDHPHSHCLRLSSFALFTSPVRVCLCHIPTSLPSRVFCNPPHASLHPQLTQRACASLRGRLTFVFSRRLGLPWAGSSDKPKTGFSALADQCHACVGLPASYARSRPRTRHLRHIRLEQLVPSLCSCARTQDPPCVAPRAAKRSFSTGAAQVSTSCGWSVDPTSQSAIKADHQSTSFGLLPDGAAKEVVQVRSSLAPRRPPDVPLNDRPT